MASIKTGKITDGGGTASIDYSATATYARSGSKVTITVKCSVYGWGHYYQAFLNGAKVIDSEDTTVYRTFTYNDASAKTYSFPMKAYVQTEAGYEGYEYTETLSVDVPAYVPDPAPDPDPDPDPVTKRVNQLIINGEMVLDLTGDTVTPETLDAGVMAHNAAGEAIVGTRASFAIANNAGAHNAIYRGQALGSAVTAAQWAAIEAGTFDDLFIGDYWTINDVNWRIAAFDYYYNTGDTLCTTHHVTIVPDTALYETAMNSTQSNAGGYVGSTMYKTGLAQALATVKSAFGDDHILTHRQAFCNATTSGISSGYGFYDSQIALMTEQNVFGGKFYGAAKTSTQAPVLMTLDNAQYPLFALDHSRINVPDKWVGLRDAVSPSNYARVTSRGSPDWTSNITNAVAVRPAFSING